MGTPVDASQVSTFGTDVTIFDTTLRDGEQSPGISLDAREKVEIAEQLARLNVDVIEAGFSAASPGDFDAVKAVAEVVGNQVRAAEADGEADREPPVIAALARALEGDIEAAAKSLAPAGRHRIHTFLSTSDIHRKYMLQDLMMMVCCKSCMQDIRTGFSFQVNGLSILTGRDAEEITLLTRTKIPPPPED